MSVQETTTQEQLDDLQFALLEALEDQSAQEATQALIRLIQAHPKPLELGQDLHDFARSLHARDLFPHHLDSVFEPLEARLRPWLATSDSTYESPEQAARASHTFSWMADYLDMFSGADADTATRLYLKAVDADPGNEQAVTGYLERVFNTSYAISEDDLGDLADRHDELDDRTRRRFHLLHLVTLHVIHGGPTSYVREAARAALERGVTATHWQEVLAWLDEQFFVSHPVQSEWFAQWTSR